MMTMQFDVDKSSNTIHVKREFNAPIEKVWAAWTLSEILDQWWAPKPWKTETKTMDFKEGGLWIYAMIGPEDEIHWSRVDFRTIIPQKYFLGKDTFCDSEGVINTNFAPSNWGNTFIPNGANTIVEIKIEMANLEAVETFINMGFKEGFTMGLSNLDELLANQTQRELA